MRISRSIVLRALALLAALYALVVVVIYAAQRKLYYPADPRPRHWASG